MGSAVISSLRHLKKFARSLRGHCPLGLTLGTGLCLRKILRYLRRKSTELAFFKVKSSNSPTSPVEIFSNPVIRSPSVSNFSCHRPKLRMECAKCTKWKLDDSKTDSLALMKSINYDTRWYECVYIFEEVHLKILADNHRVARVHILIIHVLREETEVW